MARKLRIQYPGAMYHVMSRGDRREAIFADDEDRQRLLETLTEACGKTGWHVHVYCLMRNHFHLVVETPQPNNVAANSRYLMPGTSGEATASLLGLEIGTGQNTLPVVADRFGRTPHIALSGALLALRAPDCNGWPRRWVSGRGRDWHPGRTCRIPWRWSG